MGIFTGDLKPLPHALESFAQIYSDYGDRCEILTGMPKPKRGIIYAGDDDKVNWVHKYLSERSGLIWYCVRRSFFHVSERSIS